MATEVDLNGQEIQAQTSKAKIGLIIASGLLIAGLIGAGALYSLGFFEEIDDAEAVIARMELASGDLVEQDSEANAGPKASYFEITPNLISNAAGSRKMIQLKVAVMTDYDEEERILGLVKAHDYPIRSAMLQVLSEQSEEMIAQKDFRQKLAFRLTTVINEVLTEIEGIGGIKAVYFTEFLIQ